MSQRLGNTIIIEVESDGKCELCGKVAETRPYGPNGERICYACGMKNELTTEIMMNKVLFGESNEIAIKNAHKRLGIPEGIKNV